MVIVTFTELSFEFWVQHSMPGSIFKISPMIKLKNDILVMKRGV